MNVKQSGATQRTRERSNSVDAIELVELADWAEEHSDDPNTVGEKADVILEAITSAAASRKWAEVLRLGRAVEVALILGRRWGAWKKVLESELMAARSIRDRKSEAWGLHQLGTRALALGDIPDARALLRRALELRESIGDKDGAAITRHNLGMASTGAPT